MIMRGIAAFDEVKVVTDPVYFRIQNQFARAIAGKFSCPQKGP